MQRAKPSKTRRNGEVAARDLGAHVDRLHADHDSPRAHVKTDDDVMPEMVALFAEPPREQS